MPASRRTVLLPVLALVASVLTAVALSAPAASAQDMDCSDFASQQSAQLWFLAHGGPSYDPSRLDYDSDGIACESNPCPCYYKTTSPGGSPTATAPRKRLVQYGRITHVVDGDTVDVRLASGARPRVRMLGIDTPEVYGGVECGGPQASAALKRKLPVGTRVKLVSDTSQALKDRYGRLLRYVVRVHDGRDMDWSQVRAGWARVYVYDHKPFNRVTAYRAAQAAAKAAPAGIWAVC